MDMKRLTVLLTAAVLALSLAACGGGGKEQRDATLTITKADGIVETLTSEELEAIYDENEVDYNNNYLGCEVTVEGYVLEIEQDRREIVDNIWADAAVFTLEDERGESGAVGGVTFWVNMESKNYKDLDFSTIKPGQKVRVQGTIGETFINTEIDGAQDFEVVEETE